jgi:hypothetical protein
MPHRLVIQRRIPGRGIALNVFNSEPLLLGTKEKLQQPIVFDRCMPSKPMMYL